MADEKFTVVTRGGEFVPDPEIFGGKERRFQSAPHAGDDQQVSQSEYDALKAYKDDQNRQILVKTSN